MNVLKFGGTSVANASTISQVKNIVSNQATQQIIVVVSALGGITDLLLNSAHLAAAQNNDYKTYVAQIEKRHLQTIEELLPILKQSEVLSNIKSELNTLETLLEGAFLIGEITPKLSDKIVSFGELLSSYIIGKYFISEGLDAIHVDSRTLITTNNQFGKAKVDFGATDTKIKDYARKNSNKITVMGGFIAATTHGDTTTLGRGGSDYTAAIMASALKANELQIWTDVSGMYTANPKVVKQAVVIPQISYEEAMELSHFGAKVLYPPTIQPALQKQIPIWIKNTFEPEATGTIISNEQKANAKSVSGITHIDNINLVSLEGPGMVGIPGISKRFFEVLSLAEISVVFITQASSEHSICIGIDSADSPKAVSVVSDAFAVELGNGSIKPVQVEEELAIIALIGDQMKFHQGLSGKMFSTLGKNNVNIRAIAQGASERNISAVINKTDVKKALNALHETFFEENIKQLNLFVMGVGNVGAKFLDQIQQQKNYLKERLKLNIRVIGISNSRTMLFNESGISLSSWQKDLKQGIPTDVNEFFKTITALNLRNSIFVDNTASPIIAQTYSQYLKNSISVVTCNKIACSSELKNYKNLKQLATKYNAPFLFETNVGAGLPIIDTLKNLIASGDKILKIQAVLSGSLNFVFNTFNDKNTFHDVVLQAQKEGYTEPDPKIDLSGIDVMRKILILARESGHDLNIDDIENDPFLPEESLAAQNNETFFKSLITHENEFQERYTRAAKLKSKLKYVAKFEDGKASVGLQEIPLGHDFYNLEGSDNIVLFYTERYPNQPMIIKGAGAGAEVTASGIFADIIRIGNY